MYDRRLRVNAKVEPRSLFTFTRDTLYIHRLYFIHVRNTYRLKHVKITQLSKCTVTKLPYSFD